MNFEELEASLPNGLHDAKLRRLDVDYNSRSASLLVSILTGTPDEPTREARETYRDAHIELEGVAFIAVEPPVEVGDGGDLRIDAGSGVAPTAELKIPSDLPDGCSVTWIFVSKWNAFIHIAAVSATLSWVGD